MLSIIIDQSICRDQKSGEYPDDRLRQGTVQSLLASLKGDGKILNTLNVPMPELGLCFWKFSTHSAAWIATKEVTDCPKRDTPPLSSIRWGLAATTGTLSWLHLDSSSFCTYVDTKAGFRWWIILRRKGEVHCFESISKVEAFFDGLYEVDCPNNDKWDVEAVLLPPGTRLRVV